MSRSQISIRELSGWGFDSYEYRPAVFVSEHASRASRLIAQRPPFEQSNAVVTVESNELQEGFASVGKRNDLHTEMSGLQWSLGVVDLRTLIAFQRRLALDADGVQLSIPTASDWAALIKMSFGPPKPVNYEVFHDHSLRTVTLRSTNPNLHIRTGTGLVHPLTIHGGDPFFEVARLRDRWFLRDGYHRAYTLLQAGVFTVPAVIVEVDTIEELGANEPWFFDERVLFSKNPPKVLDFLNEDLIIKYYRPPLIKTVQIKIEEALEPAAHTGEQS